MLHNSRYDLLLPVGGLGAPSASEARLCDGGDGLFPFGQDRAAACRSLWQRQRVSAALVVDDRSSSPTNDRFQEEAGIDQTLRNVGSRPKRIPVQKGFGGDFYRRAGRL
jgi:hypothetical protein